MTLDFISGPLGPLSLDLWGQDFSMLGVKGISVPSVGLVATVILLLKGNRRNHLGPLSFNIWGPNYSKTLQGPMGFPCTKFVPCGYCSFLFFCFVFLFLFLFFFFVLLLLLLLEVVEESERRRRRRKRRRRRLISKRRISVPCFTGIDNNWVLEKIGSPLIIRGTIRKRKLSCFGHIIRREESIEKRIFPGTMEGCRGRCRPITANTKIANTTNIKKWVGGRLAVASNKAIER